MVWAGTQAGGKCKAPRATTARTAPGRTRVVAVVPFGSRACKHDVHAIVYESICSIMYTMQRTKMILRGGT